MSKVRVLPVLFFVLALSLATPRTEAQTFSVLYSFTGGADGGDPVGKLVRDAKGNLYGTTTGGGVYGNGTVWKLNTAGSPTTLYSFAGQGDGCYLRCYPWAGPVRDSAGKSGHSDRRRPD